MITHRPDMLIKGKYNIIAVGGDEAAILWKDDQYFYISIDNPDVPERISDLTARSVVMKGQYVRPEPIPLDDPADWQVKVKEVHIPLLPIREQAFGKR